MIVFLISGFWHGANWTFMFWGGFFGLVYLFEYLTKKIIHTSELKKFSFLHILRILLNFSLVTFAWIFFRSKNLDDAFEMISNLFVHNNNITNNLDVARFVWIWLGLFITSDILLYNKRFDRLLDKYGVAIRWGIYAVLIWAVIVYSGVNETPFIYFQF
jgi:D-alanyl-lipoteichoic acid acyltransferase DltB (MBOAT superfamily)